MRLSARLILLAVSTSLLSLVSVGCASPGEPVERKPPIPLPITDLAASQTGNDVILTFTIPTETVDHNDLPDRPSVEIYRAIHGASGAAVGAAAPAPTAVPALLVTIPSAILDTYTTGDHFRYADSLTAGDFLPNQQQSAATYVVRTRASPKRESADSNRAELNVYPAPQPVSDLQTQALQSAIVISWTAPQTTLTGETPQIVGYLVYRANAQAPEESIPANSAKGTSGTRPVNTNPSSGNPTTAFPSPAAPAQTISPLVEIGETTTPGYRDTTAQRDKSYIYTVRSTVPTPGGKLLESADSNLAFVTLRDVFPPAAPTQLIVTALPAEEGIPAHIDLSWAINSETDLAGYNVYRSEDAGTAGTRLNPQPLPTPAFRDMNALPGRSYFYRVTAVDRTGNESAASAAVGGALPAESQASP
jgi:hypothetical protein